MAYGSNRRNKKDTDFYVINPKDPTSNRIVAQLAQGDSWHLQDWSPNDEQLLARQYVSINESYLWLFDVATGEKRLLTPPEGNEKVSYGQAKFLPGRQSILVTSDRNSEFQQLAIIELDSGKYTPLVPGITWDVESFDVSFDGKWIAFIVNEAGMSLLFLLDLATDQLRKINNIPLGVISHLSWHPSMNILGFDLSSARSTTDAYSFDIESDKLERWTESETAGLNVNQFVEPKLVKWKSFDQKTISGFLYTPPPKFSGKRPVMVVIHGGPESQFRPSFLGQYNYYLNEMGVALLFPNIRGSSGYGKSFLKLDDGYLREDSYKDIGALLQWIKAQPGLDGDRIMVTGASYGGHVTLAVATMYDDQIACSLDIVGMSNLVTFLERTEAYRQDLRRVEYGDERDPEMRAFLERIAPLNNARKITKPLFIVQGMNDPRVPASEAEQMVATVKYNNTPVWYLAAKDEGHGFIKKKNREFLLYSTVTFMRNFLQ